MSGLFLFAMSSSWQGRGGAVLFIAVNGLLIMVTCLEKACQRRTSVVGAHRLSSCSSRALEHGLK